MVQIIICNSTADCEFGCPCGYPHKKLRRPCFEWDCADGEDEPLSDYAVTRLEQVITDAVAHVNNGDVYPGFEGTRETWSSHLDVLRDKLAAIEKAKRTGKPCSEWEA